MTDLFNVISNFRVEGLPYHWEKYGGGHINETYVITLQLPNGSWKRYVLQKINTKVFPDVDGLMKNAVAVTSFIKNKLQTEGAYDRAQTLNFLSTIDGKEYLNFEGECYRCYEFIDWGTCLESIPEPWVFELAGKGFGRFQKLLGDFPAETLSVPLKDFHNTEVRFAQLEKAINEDRAGRVESCGEIIRDYISRKHYASRIMDKLRSGEIPLRVTHNDTKLNNVLLDLQERKPLAVLDLDTVMPGSSLFDFGDAIRFGASTAAEDETDLDKVQFSLPLFKAYAKGFMEELSGTLTQAEKDNLAFSALLMTLECGSRFLADHLNGDMYFRIHRPNHNLDRAKTQMKLVKEMEKYMHEMEEYVKSLN